MTELLYEQVAANIMKRIQNKELKENDKLSERQLAKEFQVSRTVVREAMKLLNEKGLVYTIYGKGSYVRAIDDTSMMSRMENLMDMSNVDHEDVVAVREILESSMVPLIISNVTEEDIMELKKCYEKMEETLSDTEAFVENDKSFHILLAMCTHNRVLGIMVGTLNLMEDRNQLLQGVELRRNANQEHLQIIEAIEKKEYQLLQNAMKEHIACIRDHSK